jgi:hypothetical protein
MSATYTDDEIIILEDDINTTIETAPKVEIETTIDNSELNL